MHHHHLLDRDLPIFPAVFFNRTFKLHLKTLMISPTFNPRNTGLTLLPPQHDEGWGFFGDPWRNTAMRRPPRFGRNEQFGKAVIFQSSTSLSLNDQSLTIQLGERHVCTIYVHQSYCFTNICFVVQIVFFWHWRYRFSIAVGYPGQKW